MSKIIKNKNNSYFYMRLTYLNCCMKKYSLIFILYFFVACEAIFVEDITNDSVIIQAPTDNSQVTTGNITFTWQPVDEADLYEVQIATPNFQNASQILLDTITDSNSVVKSLDTGTYGWRVKAMNSEYETGYSTVNFTVN